MQSASSEIKSTTPAASPQVVLLGSLAIISHVDRGHGTTSLAARSYDFIDWEGAQGVLVPIAWNSPGGFHLAVDVDGPGDDDYQPVHAHLAGRASRF